MDAKEYIIENVTDFLNVPLDRLGACLKEFSQWLAFVIAVETIHTGVEYGHKFVWVDDGLSEGRVYITGVNASGETVYHESMTYDLEKRK